MKDTLGTRVCMSAGRCLGINNGPTLIIVSSPEARSMSTGAPSVLAETTALSSTPALQASMPCRVWRASLWRFCCVCSYGRTLRFLSFCLHAQSSPFHCLALTTEMLVSALTMTLTCVPDLSLVQSSPHLGTVCLLHGVLIHGGLSTSKRFWSLFPLGLMRHSWPVSEDRVSALHLVSLHR